MTAPPPSPLARVLTEIRSVAAELVRGDLVPLGTIKDDTDRQYEEIERHAQRGRRLVRAADSLTAHSAAVAALVEAARLAWDFTAWTVGERRGDGNPNTVHQALDAALSRLAALEDGA